MNVSYEPQEANIMVVSLSGRLDANTSPQIKTALHQLIEEGYLKIIVDLHQVPFIDSSGLAALVSGLRLAREKDVKIVLSNVQPQTQIIFRLTMMDRVFEIFPTSAEAKQSLL
jgi:anti-sigma B factor antagonist